MVETLICELRPVFCCFFFCILHVDSNKDTFVLLTCATWCLRECVCEGRKNTATWEKGSVCRNYVCLCEVDPLSLCSQAANAELQPEIIAKQRASFIFHPLFLRCCILIWHQIFFLCVCGPVKKWHLFQTAPPDCSMSRNRQGKNNTVAHTSLTNVFLFLFPVWDSRVDIGKADNLHTIN